MRSRRGLLAGLACIGTAGCTSLAGSTPTPTPTARPDSDGDGAPDSEDDYPNDYVRSDRIFAESGEANVDVQDHQAFRFSQPDGRAMVLYYDLIVEGGGIDVILFPREEYLNYTNGDDFRYYDEQSALGVGSATVEKFVSPGRYVLVFDNTATATRPTDVRVTVDYEIEVAEIGPES